MIDPLIHGFACLEVGPRHRMPVMAEERSERGDDRPSTTCPRPSSSSSSRTAGRPYAAIGKAVGLSEAAVRQRVQRLLDAGVMQIVAVTDPLTVGFPRAAMIGIRVEGDSEVVADKLAGFAEIDYVVLTAG